MSESKEDFGKHIVKCPPEYSMCTGCASCEMVCSMVHDQLVSPSYNRIFLQLGPTTTMIHDVFTCMQCADHPCYEACPLKDKAMCINEKGIVIVKEEECIGCGKCRQACKFTPPRINIVKSKDKTKRKAKKCDLCSERAEGPSCVQYCPARCLALSGEPLPWESDDSFSKPDFVDIYAVSNDKK